MEQPWMESTEIQNLTDSLLPKPNAICLKPIELKDDLQKLYEDNSTDLEIDDLVFGYKKNTTVIDHMTFRFERGKIYHLIGANGAGKSTLAKLITGVLRPNHGSISFGALGTNPFRTPGKQVAYCFQDPDEQFFATNIVNELVGSQRAKLVSDRVETLISLFDLDFVKRRHPEDVEFSVKKRVSLAAALSMDRPWYILDEPTLGQDDENVRGIRDIVRELASLGKGFIIISHSEEFFVGLEHSRINLSNGKVSIGTHGN
jgi:energy-coupling factor transport system ATP-binding protein